MASPLKVEKQELTLANGNEKTGKTTKEKVENTLTSELIFGICTPIGSLKEPVVDTIEKILEDKYGYEVKRIKISEFIAKYSSIKSESKPGETQAFTKLMSKIKGGDEIRKKFHFSSLIELAIYDINLDRVGKGLTVVPHEELESRRKCFIIDSIKNKEELNLLRSVYKDIFYSFSIFSPVPERIEHLLAKGLSREEIKKITEVDEFENNDEGQNVRDTFVDGDFFIRISKENLSSINDKVDRYLSLIFESKIITPNPDEIAMYEAKSAAGNSACLSRQVGAAITNDKGEIISRGWNDVPKFGGNLYKDGEIVDNRCITNGFCSNDKTKDVVTKDVIEIIKRDEFFIGTLGVLGSEMQEKIINRLTLSIRKNTKVKDLIEFSRSVHAEMHAIIIGSQLAGNKMVGGKLFCTTYPCHNCARHLIVAGIKEIFYIEPYVKSLCLQLHSDTITEEEKATNKVRILMFDGVAPRRFLDFFTMSSKRKDDKGDIVKPDLKKIDPKRRLTIQALPTLEAQAIISLKETGLIVV